MMFEYLSTAFEKWKSNAVLYNEMEALRKEVVSIKYSDRGSFDLDKFNGKKFTSKIKLRDLPEGLWENYTTYFFNKANLPIIADMQHAFNKQTWSGYFVYSGEETRYVVFEHNDFTASTLQWVEWRDGKKRSSNLLRFQYGPAEYLKLDVASFVDHVRRNQPGSLIWRCEIFNYDEQEDRISTADSFSHSPDLGFFKEKKIYTYSKDGKLETIKSEMLQADNCIRTGIEFSRTPKGETLRSLTDNLADRMSHTIFNTLLLEKTVSPIVQVELYYRPVEYYTPLIQYATEEEVDQFEHSTIHDLTERFFGSQWMKHSLDWKMDEETELLYARFFNRVSDAQNWQAGDNMMYLIAKKLTAKAVTFAKASFSDDFFSYALDYEIDCSQVDKILIKCGVSKSQVDAWKKKGIL